MAGVRVGEATNPGPVHPSRRRRRRVSSDESGLQETSARNFEVESDDAPLVSPTPACATVVDSSRSRRQFFAAFEGP